MRNLSIRGVGSRGCLVAIPSSCIGVALVHLPVLSGHFQLAHVAVVAVCPCTTVGGSICVEVP